MTPVRRLAVAETTAAAASLTSVLDDSDVQRVLAIQAHPDDIDFLAAGSIATWSDKGIDVTYCIVTNGDAGGFDEAVDRADIAGIGKPSSGLRPPRSESPT